MPLPAHQLLHPDCALRPAWAVFDRAWYLQHHSDARGVCADKPAEVALLYYLRVGARQGHSPNPFFDENYYLARNPDIAELVRGPGAKYQSGFDHFCQYGHRGVSPHWLFDDELYASLYDDMTLENLDQHQCYGRYDHYLRSGQRERRMGHFLFDSQYYRERAIEAGLDAAEIDLQGPYAHFLRRLGTQDELAPSVYFDPFWYGEHHPGAKAEIARGRYLAAIHHYLTNDTPEHFDPVPEFSESFYRRRYPDIAMAVENGMYRSAYQQFVQYGAFELRQPASFIDLAFYRDMHERVRNDLNSGVVRDAFAHLRLIGLREGLAYFPPEQRPALEEAQTRALFALRARANLVLFARHRLDFSCRGKPELSVVMVLFNRFELTMLALTSLRDNFSGPIQLIIVDNDSHDDTMRLVDYVHGALILRQDQNIGFLRACNVALPFVQAPAMLYLNNDTELLHGAIAAALARLRGDEKIGAVGGKIIRTNGQLQEAGSIIWNEGTTAGYMRDASPLAPEANFLRDVDYCSAVFLLCRTALVRELGGFDEIFGPAYFEDADLCVRMSQAGFRVVYDPAVAVMHYEFGSALTTESSMALMRRGKRIFKRKHRLFLEGQHTPSQRSMVAARSRGRQPRILFIEDTVPLRRLGSGFVRSNDIVRAIDAAGYEVHVFPVNGASQDLAATLRDLPERTEIMYDRDFTGMAAFLAERHELYDLVWIARAHNLRRSLPLLIKAGIDPAKVPVILDSEAVAAGRDAARAVLTEHKFEFLAALREEFAQAQFCRRVLAVNAREAGWLRELGLETVSELGTARPARPTRADFRARKGLLFVAAIHQPDSPNLDALHWYLDEILPALEETFNNVPILDVVGYAAPEIDLRRFENHPKIRLHGSVSNLRPFYESARLFIAPARFAGGAPYKLYESASFGVPFVTTGLLRDQLGWVEGKELLSAECDGPAFARQIARLYRQRPLWTRLRDNALARIGKEHRPVKFNARVAALLAGVLRDASF